MQFFDASALVKRYVRESESAAVRRALARGPVVALTPLSAFIAYDARLVEAAAKEGLPRWARTLPPTTRGSRAS